MQRQGTVGDGMKGVPVNVVTAEKEKEKARADAELDEMLQMERECSQSQWGEEPPFEEPKSAYNSYKDKNTTQPYSQPQPSFSQPFPQSTYSQPSNSQPLSQPTPTYTQPTYSQQPLSQPTQPTFQPTFFQPSTSGFQVGDESSSLLSVLLITFISSSTVFNPIPPLHLSIFYLYSHTHLCYT
ncbi:hypothetical protein B484DRAFT_227600 [Ochromonadaceae sp. CCMP2298]|nr:hypothetical protein B484DRAFT_227600 [Ochromonadaceae sp. CCMP2298]